jgi:N-acetylglucosamine malate deacetylase 2
MRYPPAAVSLVPAPAAAPAAGSPGPAAASGRLGHWAPAARGRLPHAETVLAVIAHPGQESADLGGLLYAFRSHGARLVLLSLTRGEASPLNASCEQLETLRPWELQVAAAVLGISSVAVAGYADGGLSQRPLGELTERVQRQIRHHSPDLLLVIDPVAARSDDAVVAQAACAAAQLTGVPAVARTTLGRAGGWLIELDGEAAGARAVQRSAAAAHTSQSGSLPEVEHRIARMGGGEWLRWLVPAPMSNIALSRSPLPFRGYR